MLHPHVVAQIVVVGIGATAVMDAWLALLVRMGVPTTSFALVGRWVAISLAAASRIGRHLQSRARRV
jgi:hypothetical protein